MKTNQKKQSKNILKNSLKKYFSVFFLGLFLSQMLPNIAFCQNKIDREKYQLKAQKTTENINIDGIADEKAWQNAEIAKDFFQNFPFDTAFATTKTEVKMLFDDNFVYVSAVCKNQKPEDYVVTSLKRDFNAPSSDFFLFVFDSFLDETNGFAFTVNPLGVQREGLVANGGGQGSDADWDNKWYSKTAQYEDYWTVEMAIPFKSIRYKNGSNEWFVNFGRSTRKINEFSSWVPVNRNFGLSNLGFTGKLLFSEPLPKPTRNISLIPYITTTYNKNQEKNTSAKLGANIGGDAKIAVTPSLNLDLTFNPDFAQVEVDAQVTNLDRFEIFFPERRQFFIENSDLFARSGFSQIRPFFSRRIGIGRDTSTGLIVQNPILYGARLSGKLNKDWRIGALNMQTVTDKDKGILATNYSVATFQRRIFTRSNIAGIFVNRQRTTDANGNFELNNQNYTRIIGLDYNMFSANNRWVGKFFYHKLLTDKQLTDTYTHASYLGYTVQKFNFNWNHEYVGTNYNPNDIGFVRRLGHWRLEPSAAFNFFPKPNTNSNLNRQQLTFYSNFYWTLFDIANVVKPLDLTDRTHAVGYNASFKNTSGINFSFFNNFVKLFRDFDPSNTGQPTKLKAGTSYEMYGWNFGYNSDGRKLFTYGINQSYQNYYDGNLFNLGGSFGYRLQPLGTFSLAANFNRVISLGTTSNLFLISPRVDLSFTKSLFLTTVLQYNSQIENMNFNARLQWRFKPVSDLFVVYTDNYFTEDFKIRNRSIVLKLTYWLNI